MPGGLHFLRDYVRFRGLAAERRRLVVYSEGPASWPHLGPVVHALLARHELPLAYVSSAANDPGLQLAHLRMQGFLIGDGHVRTMFFNTLDADTLLTTMPDLGSFHLKRSAGTRQYVYLHHSLVSSHMVYRNAAFDHFDVILCAGPHHEREIRAIEALHGRASKQLVAHGYGRLDAILASAPPAGTPEAAPPIALLAPSWGPGGLLEKHGDALLRGLAAADWTVLIRPHPATLQHAAAMALVRQWCERTPRLQLDTDVAGHGSLLRASVMISDWSGAAFDFALGRERPVLFIDTPRKVNNPHYQQLDIEPIEVFAREEIGTVVGLNDLARLPEHLTRMADAAAQYRHAIAGFRQRWVHHPGASAPVAADWLAANLR